jgi:hypothetical protein
MAREAYGGCAAIETALRPAYQYNRRPSKTVPMFERRSREPRQKPSLEEIALDLEVPISRLGTLLDQTFLPGIP